MRARFAGRWEFARYLLNVVAYRLRHTPRELFASIGVPPSMAMPTIDAHLRGVVAIEKTENALVLAAIRDGRHCHPTTGAYRIFCGSVGIAIPICQS
jgi:hypothetical protein